MATDPFVPPKLEDTPRQRQNLAPGSEYPPAEAWMPRRAGDLRSGQPTGTLLGAPGPNIGFALKLARRRADTMRLAPHEDIDDAVAVVAEIAMRRSATIPRAPVVHDVDFAIRLLGYDGDPTDAFEWRREVVDGTAEDWTRRRLIVDAVPEWVLRVAMPELDVRLDEFREALQGAVVAAVARPRGVERAEGA